MVASSEWWLPLPATAGPGTIRNVSGKPHHSCTVRRLRLHNNPRVAPSSMQSLGTQNAVVRYNYSMASHRTPHPSSSPALSVWIPTPEALVIILTKRPSARRKLHRAAHVTKPNLIPPTAGTLEYNPGTHGPGSAANCRGWTQVSPVFRWLGLQRPTSRPGEMEALLQLLSQPYLEPDNTNPLYQQDKGSPDPQWGQQGNCTLIAQKIARST